MSPPHFHRHHTDTQQALAHHANTDRSLVTPNLRAEMERQVEPTQIAKKPV